MGSPPFQPPTRCSRPSTPPKRSPRAVAHPREDSSSRRSTTLVSMRSSGRPRSAARASRRSWARSVRASEAPSSARRLATVGPRPPAAPAMAKTRPSREELTALTLSVCGSRQDVVELRLQLDVEEAERELVVADEVDELLGLLHLGEVAAGGGPAGGLGGRDVFGDEVVGGDPLAELRAVDAGVVEVVDALAQGADAVGEGVPVDPQLVVGPVDVALLVEEGEQQLAAEAVVVAHARAGDREAEEAVEEERVLDVGGGGGTPPPRGSGPPRGRGGAAESPPGGKSQG